MSHDLLQTAYENRFLRTRGEVEAFEAALAQYAVAADDQDLPALYRIFEDETAQHEVMFGLVHLIEAFPAAVRLPAYLRALPAMMANAADWADTFMARSLNGTETNPLLADLLKAAPREVRDAAVRLLTDLARAKPKPVGVRAEVLLTELTRGYPAPPVTRPRSPRTGRAPRRRMAERDFEVALSYLDRLLRDELRDDWMATIAIIACRQNLRDYPYVARSIPTVNDRPHAYGPNRTPVAPPGQRQRVFQAMQRNGAFSAPAWSHKPITTGTVSMLWPLNDMVVRLVDSARLLIYNVTLPKHILFPGFVKLAVEEAGNATVVAVSGKGSGNWAYANETGGPVLFRSLLEDLAYHLRHHRQ